MRRLLLLPFLLLGLAACAVELDAQHCQSLKSLPVAGTELSAASLVAEVASLPAYCQVEGTISGRVSFVLRLPQQNWNGKFAVAGCGGFCGSLEPDNSGHSNSINEALKLGYAAITTDGGHKAPSWSTDWAMQDPPALDLYAGAWMPLAVATGRALVHGFYGNQARRTYFEGCSNGGRLAMMAAQRYPTLFDGIAGGGAIFDITGNAGIHGLWLLQTVRDRDGNAVIDPTKIPLLQAQVLQQCDSLDGVEDGVVSRPELCEPELDSLQCAGESTASCFSETELAAVRRLYQGATVDGVQLFPGMEPGSESLWPIWVTGTDDNVAWGEGAAEGNLRLTYGVPSDQPFNPHDYVLADELENVQRLAPTLNATDPDLSALAAAGGKLFYYHGLADPLILPGRAQQYYEEAIALQGKEKLDQVARFIMVPGQGHCWEKPGQVADEFIPLVVIDNWVESGQAPDYVVAVQKDMTGEVIRSRKLCALPLVAELRGGDQRHADNYECVNP